MGENFTPDEHLMLNQIKLPSRPIARMSEYVPPTGSDLMAEMDAAKAEYDRQPMPEKFA